MINILLKGASVAGKALGIPLPRGIPFLDEVLDYQARLALKGGTQSLTKLDLMFADLRILATEQVFDGAQGSVEQMLIAASSELDEKDSEEKLAKDYRDFAQHLLKEHRINFRDGIFRFFLSLVYALRVLAS